MKKYAKQTALALAMALAVTSVAPATVDAASKPKFKKTYGTVKKGAKLKYVPKLLKKNSKVTWKITGDIKNYVSFSKSKKVVKETGKTVSKKTYAKNYVYVRKNATKVKKGYIKAVVVGKNGKKYTLSDKIAVAKKATTKPTTKPSTKPSTNPSVNPSASVVPSATADVTTPPVSSTGPAVSATPSVEPSATADATETAVPTATAPASAVPTGPATTTPPVVTDVPTTVPSTPPSITTTPSATVVPTETPAVTLAAVAASAVSTNKIAVTFNKPVTASAIKADDVVVTETSERKFVKTVTNDANDSKVLIVEFYDNLTSGKTYKVSVSIDGKAYDMDVAYTQGQPAKIVVEDQIIPAGVATQLKYKVLDANGLDITDATSVEYTSDRQSDIADGKITLASGTTAFVKITCTVTNGTNVTTITSDQFTVRAEAAVAKELANYTTFDGTGARPNYSDAAYKQDLNVLEDSVNTKLDVQLKNQFGDVITPAYNGDVTFESLDTTVAVVDKTTGSITPLKVGTVPVKVTYGTDFSQTIMLSIVAKSTVQKIVVKDTALTIYPGLDNKTASTNVKLEDQYGKASYTGLTANIKSGNDLITIDTTYLAINGNLEVTAKAADKTGTAVVEVTNGTFKQNIAVSLVPLGTTVGYDVAGAKATLDKNSSANSADSNYQADTMTFSVNPVDKDGKISGNPASFTYTVKEGSTEVIPANVASQGAIIAIGSDGIVTGKTYTVTVKVGNMEVKTFQFNTVDTRKAPAVTVAKTSATITSAKAAEVSSRDDLAALLGTGDGKLGILNVGKAGCTLSNLQFVTTDSTAINQTTGAISKTGTIVLKSVDVTDGGNTFTVALTGSITINVVNGATVATGSAVTGVSPVAAVPGVYEVEITTNVADGDTITIAGKELAVLANGAGNAAVGTSFEAGSDVQGTLTNILAALAGNMPENYTVTSDNTSKLILTQTTPNTTAPTVATTGTGEVGSVTATTTPVVGVAAKQAEVALTVDTANVAGTLTVTLDGITEVSVPVQAADTKEQIAAKLQSAIDAKSDYTATVSGAVVTVKQAVAATGDITVTSAFTLAK